MTIGLRPVSKTCAPRIEDLLILRPAESDREAVKWVPGALTRPITDSHGKVN